MSFWVKPTLRFKVRKFNIARHKRKLWNHLFPARGCVHLQHTILCTWEASSLTLGCTWTVVTSPAHTLSHTLSLTRTNKTTGQAFRGTETAHQSFCLTWYHSRSVTEHSSLCCGTHRVLVNTTRATVLALAHGETKTQMLFLVSTFFFFFCSPSYRRVRKGCGCKTTDYTSSLSFVISQCRLGL